MADGYFVGRKELAEWIRDNFDPGFSKVEDLASGVVYCKIMDSIYPGSVSMSKVKKDAKIEVDFIHNFRVRRARAAPGPRSLGRGVRSRFPRALCRPTTPPPSPRRSSRTPSPRRRSTGTLRSTG